MKPTATELLAALDTLRRFFVAAPEADDAWIDARTSGVNPRSIRRAVATGELEASKVGRALLVRRSELDRWLSGRRVRPAITSPERVSAPLRALGGRPR